MKFSAKKLKSLSPKVQVEVINAGVAKFQLVMEGAIKPAVKYAGIAFCLWIIFKGLTDVGRLNVGALKALGSLVYALKLHVIIGYLSAVLTGLGWQYERLGKKRAIKKLGELRKSLEQNDSYRSSSGLRENGDTPDQ